MSEPTPPAGPQEGPDPTRPPSQDVPGSQEAGLTEHALRTDPPDEPLASAPPVASEPLASAPPVASESLASAPPVASESLASVPVAAEPIEPLPTPTLEPVRPEARPRAGLIRLAGYLVAAVAGAALLLAGLGAAGGIALPTSSPSPSPAYMQGAALGDPAAPVSIEVWADYQCPYCALQARGIEPSIERTLVEPGKARLVFRDFAFLSQGRPADESKSAAVAARCAGRQNAYWYYHDLLFSSQQGENQGAFARERLLGLSAFAGLDQAAFTTCLADPTVAAAVEAETGAGRALGVSSTPTMRIIGPGGTEMLTGVKPLAEIQAAVERMSKPAPSGSPASGSPVSSGSPTPPASTSSSAASSVPSPSPSPSS